MTALVSRHERFVHDQFRALVLSPSHPCLGAHAAVRHGHYDFRLYDELGAAESALRLRNDLCAFSETRRSWSTRYATFVAAFAGPVPADEPGFERLLWLELQLIHDAAIPGEAWDPRVSSSPDDPRFSFSVGGQAYFVVGLHGASSRFARRCAWPTLCFNPHEQFDELREAGHFVRMREQVRERDRRLQGTLNPMLADHGSRSEASQYSGRDAEETWRCPLHVRRK
jgi:FPC/CPF motif-containing protein YcgG